MYNFMRPIRRHLYSGIFQDPSDKKYVKSWSIFLKIAKLNAWIDIICNTWLLDGSLKPLVGM